MTVRCPVCGAAVALAVGETRLSCTACGLAAPLSHVGTAPGAMLALETDLTGRVVAGRTLVERIGAGGMGTVYRGRAAADRGDVAVKVLRPGLGAERAAMLARFAREAEAMRRLEHARVVRFLDHGEDGDIAYIVTELVEGRDLAQRLAAGRMDLAEIVDVFGQVCDGVAAAHAAGIVHRDLKPANILVGADGVKVADFGLAQLGADVVVPTLTRTDVAMGTFHYLAPEQRKDARTVDHRADVWALGVIFYEMLTGELPLGSFAPPTDKRADAIVRKALAPDPARRYQTVTAFARDVRALVAPRRVRRPLVAAVIVALAAGTGTAIAFVATTHHDDPPAGVAAAADPAANRAADAADAAARSTIDPAGSSSRSPSAPLAAAPRGAAPPGASPPDAATPPDARVTPALDTELVAALGPAVLGAGAFTAQPPRRVPTGTGKPVGKVVGAGGAAAPPTGGKTKKPEATDAASAKPAAVAPVCRTTRTCCNAVKGSDCGAWLRAEANACSTALADFQTRATNPKQRFLCGLRGK